MKEKLILYDINNNKINCDVLIRFTYDGNKYIVYTDNTYNKSGEFNLYEALIDNSNKLREPSDIKVMPIFDTLIYEYKKKVIKGEIWC